MYDNISLIIWLILIVILTIMNLFQSNYDIRYWVMFTLLTIFLQYIHCYDSTSFFCFVLLTCYVQVMSFCSRLCSNYEMHSLLQIHKSERVTTVFFVYSSGPSRGPGRGVRAVSASWSWNATKATKSWCKIAVKWRRTPWRELVPRRFLWVVWARISSPRRQPTPRCPWQRGQKLLGRKLLKFDSGSRNSLLPMPSIVQLAWDE